VASQADGQPVFYLQWNDEGDGLAYIRNSRSGGTVEVGVARPGDPIDPVGDGVPFYLSWGPGRRLLGHADQSSIRLYNASTPDERGFISVAAVDGGFSAPAWIDDERALVVADEALSYLDVASGELEAIIDVGGPIRFVLSPDGRRVAYRRLAAGGESASPEVAAGVIGSALASIPPRAVRPVQDQSAALLVLDLDTGRQTTVTDEVTVAWEWSPDGQRLAWLEAEVTGGGVTGAWNFWSVDQSIPAGAPATERTPEFQLTRKYIQGYLPFFAQYTQSVTGWSPDSSAFAFAGTIGGLPGVWVQLVDERVAPRLVSRGDLVTWGPGLPPPLSNAASAA
jgi:TolB protein